MKAGNYTTYCPGGSRDKGKLVVKGGAAKKLSADEWQYRKKGRDRGVWAKVGKSEWRTRLVESLPKKLQSSLPTVKQIEAELAVELQPIKVPARDPKSDI